MRRSLFQRGSPKFSKPPLGALSFNVMGLVPYECSSRPANQGRGFTLPLSKPVTALTVPQFGGAEVEIMSAVLASRLLFQVSYRQNGPASGYKEFSFRRASSTL